MGSDLKAYPSGVRLELALRDGELGGYEAWQVVAVSEDGGLMAAIVANPR